MRFYLVLFILALTTSVQADFRVYKLKISNTKTGKSREITSVLTPKQYVFYNPITWYETVEMLDHWMCWQRNDGFKPLCTRPFDSLAKGPKAGSPVPAPAPLSP